MFAVPYTYDQTFCFIKYKALGEPKEQAMDSRYRVRTYSNGGEVERKKNCPFPTEDVSKPISVSGKKKGRK